MMIGIITFHWATNYGAVLQAYALQTYLKKHGHDVHIINYTPYSYEKKITKCFVTRRPWQIPQRLLDYMKEQRFRSFRNKYLCLSPRFTSFESLKKSPPLYDAYICGSDQIWNPGFTREGEGKFTPSYFLDFGHRNVRRIAYAVSFGCVNYPRDLLKKISPLLAQFDAISVRENSGKKIVQQAGVENVMVMPDPTLLLEPEEYELLLTPKTGNDWQYIFFYMLHSEQHLLKDLKEYIFQKLRNQIIDTRNTSHAAMGIERWLGLIKSANMVVTNSYHGMIFSILFKIPFLIVLVEGRSAGMNDRVITLLNSIGLTDRIVDGFNKQRIEAVLEKKIDWTIAECRIGRLRKNASSFFDANLKFVE